MLTLPRDGKMGSQSPLCLERVPRKGKAARQQKNNIDNTSSGHGICEFMGLCWKSSVWRVTQRNWRGSWCEVIKQVASQGLSGLGTWLLLKSVTHSRQGAEDSRPLALFSQRKTPRAACAAFLSLVSFSWDVLCQNMHNTVSVFSCCRWRLVADDNMTQQKKDNQRNFHGQGKPISDEVETILKRTEVLHRKCYICLEPLLTKGNENHHSFWMALHRALEKGMFEKLPKISQKLTILQSGMVSHMYYPEI